MIYRIELRYYWGNRTSYRDFVIETRAKNEYIAIEQMECLLDSHIDVEILSIAELTESQG